MSEPKKRTGRKQLKPRRSKAASKAKVDLRAMEPLQSAEELTAEQLPPIVHRVHRLKALGFKMYEISAKIGQEFDLQPPGERTLYRWIDEAQEAYLEDIAKFRRDETMDSLNRIEVMLARWMPVAAAEHLEIYRKRREDGQTIAILDENAFQEQSKAADIVLKYLMLKAEVLGMKNGGVLIPDASKDRTIADLFAFVGSMAAKRVTGQVVEEESNLLELKSGFTMPPLDEPQPEQAVNQ